MGNRFVANKDRIQHDLEALALIGKTGPNAVTRLAFTKEDIEARDYIIGRMKEIGLEVSIDAFGNTIGRYINCDNPSLPAVASGSHLDGPPNGGIYDGVVGVLAAVEAVRLFNEYHIRTQCPIEVVITQCEHLDRFGVSCLGSRALAGKLTQEHLDTLKDCDGITLRRALEKINLRPTELEKARRASKDWECFVELHIEQGRVLEELNKRIGIVTGIAGPSRPKIEIIGLADHSGGTPMWMRRDALCAAADIILWLEQAARARSHEGVVATVGVIKVEPGAIHTIPGRAILLPDIRSSPHAETKRELLKEFEAEIENIKRKRGVEINYYYTVNENPVPCSGWIIDTIRLVCEELNIDYHVMPSGGGHDAQHIASFTHSGMIFVPSVKGISHQPMEFTELDDICLGTEVLANSLLRLSSSESHIAN